MKNAITLSPQFNRCSCKNFALNDLHSSRARGIAIVEAV